MYPARHAGLLQPAQAIMRHDQVTIKLTLIWMWWMQYVGKSIGATEDLIAASPPTPACLSFLKSDWSERGKEWPNLQAFVLTWRLEKLQREVNNLCGHKRASCGGQAAWPPSHQVWLVQQLMELENVPCCHHMTGLLVRSKDYKGQVRSLCHVQHELGEAIDKSMSMPLDAHHCRKVCL